jgi:hypothetical protein
MLDEIVGRLKEAAPMLRLVQGAAEYAALKAPPPTNYLPAAYVIPLRDSAGPSPLVNAVRQQIHAEVGIIIMCGAATPDPRGGGEVIAIEAVRQAVRAALLGWKIDPEHDPLQAAGGDLVGFDGATVTWQDAYSTVFYIRGV